MKTLMLEVKGWHAGAACRDANPDEFDPDQPWAAAARTIRRHCNHCPVVSECHADAEQTAEVGVWGAHYRTLSRAYPIAELEAGPKARCGERRPKPEPGPMQCERCRRFMKPYGAARHGGDGLCSGCHRTRRPA